MCKLLFIGLVLQLPDAAHCTKGVITLDVFKSIFNWLGGLLNDVLGWVLFMLPDSPFVYISKSPLAPYIAYINWFVPVDFILSVLVAWLAAIGIYYAYQVILRWIKAIN